MRPLLSILLLAPALFVAPASATIDACTSTSQTHFVPLALTFDTVTGPLAYTDGSCNGTGVVGGPWPGLAACASPAVHATASTYCGPYVPAGMTVVCTYAVDAGPIEFFTVGFDRNGDGHIFGDEGAQRIEPTADVALASRLVAATVGSHVLTNLGDGGRVIAYPTAIAPGPPGSARVGCA